MPKVSYFTVSGAPGVPPKGKHNFRYGSPHPKKIDFRSRRVCVFVHVLMAKTTIGKSMCVFVCNPCMCLCAIRVCVCVQSVCVFVCNPCVCRGVVGGTSRQPKSDHFQTKGLSTMCHFLTPWKSVFLNVKWPGGAGGGGTKCCLLMAERPQVPKMQFFLAGMPQRSKNAVF